MNDLNNIFLALRSYRPKPEGDSKEDYFTASFAYILNTHKDLALEILKFIFKDSKNIDIKEISSIDIQKEYGNSTLDMEILLENKTKIFFEHKLGARIRGDQIKKYLRIAREENGYLVYIALNDDLIEGKFLEDPLYIKPEGDKKHFLWRDIYHIINKFYLEHMNNSDELLKQFLEYMREENMEPAKPIIKEDFEVFRKYREFESNFGKLLGKTRRYFENNNYNVTKQTPGSLNVTKKDWSGSEFYLGMSFDKKGTKFYLQFRFKIKQTEYKRIEIAEKIDQIEKEKFRFKNYRIEIKPSSKTAKKPFMSFLIDLEYILNRTDAEGQEELIYEYYKYLVEEKLKDIIESIRE